MSQVNILVVDDREEGIISVQAVLESKDYNIITARSGEEALKCLLKMDFAVILMDVQMPGMNGFETAQVIKTREKSRHIPIIFMSAINQDEKYVYEGYDVGAVDYILKPFDPYILKAKVQTFADIHKKNILIKDQARKIYENELKNYANALDRLELESLRRYQNLADSIPHIVFKIKPDMSYEYFNKTWVEYTGLPIELCSGQKWQHAFYPDDLNLLKEIFDKASSANQHIECECRILSKSHEFRWHLVRLQPEYTHVGGIISGWVGSATDFEDHKQDEEHQRLLAKVGEILVSSLDFDRNIQHMTEFFVKSRFADFCAIDILEEKQLKTLALISHPFSFQKEMEEFYLRLKDVNSDFGPGYVFKTGESQLYSLQNMQADELKNPAKKINLRSAFTVPLTSQEGTVGAMTFFACENGKIFGRRTLQVAEEIGRRVSLAFENSRLYKISQNAVEVRNEFLSIASHELNTPITSLKLQLQMTKKILDSGNMENIQLDKFSTAVASSLKQIDRLIHLVQVLLDITRIQSHQLTFEFEPMNLTETIRDIKERFKEVLANSHSELELEIAREVNVNWDKTRIEQVLVNLLTNAIKYAPGRIKFQVKEENGKVEILFQDYGQGIPEEKLGSIFERFSRVGAKRSISGLGLGLFIVKQIIEGHHGRIDVQAEKNKGTCFKITLPVDPSEASELTELPH